MSTKDNKALVHRLIEEVWNQGHLAVFDELYAPDFRFHDPGLAQVRTREEDKQWIAGVLHAFPDFHLTIEDMIAEEDQVAVRLTARGTNTGDILAPMPHPATSKYVILAIVASGSWQATTACRSKRPRRLIARDGCIRVILRR